MKTIRTAAQRLTTGTGTLTQQFGCWLLPGQLRTAVSRLAGCTCGGALAWTIVDRQPAAMGLAAAGLVVGAWRAGTPHPTETAAEEPADDDGEPAGLDPDLVADALRELADPHVHLAAVATLFGTDTAPVRAALTAAGIPIAPGVRVQGRVSTGVRADDIPPLLPAPSDDPRTVVVAGQPSNNNSNDRAPYMTQEGFWITPDPHRAHGWNVTTPRT